MDVTDRFHGMKKGKSRDDMCRRSKDIQVANIGVRRPLFGRDLRESVMASRLVRGHYISTSLRRIALHGAGKAT